MATETIIVRPAYVQFNEANNTVYPSSLSPDNTHMAINEEVADDDASYIITKFAAQAPIGFLIPEDYIDLTPTSINVYFKAKEDQGSRVGIAYAYDINDSGRCVFAASRIETIYTTTYQNYCVAIPKEDLSAFYNYTKQVDSNMKPKYGTVAIVGESTKSNTTITQVYLELIYGEPEDAIYIKENGSWNMVSGTVYKKQNGVWTAVDSSTLQNEMNYILEIL